MIIAEKEAQLLRCISKKMSRGPKSITVQGLTLNACSGNFACSSESYDYINIMKKLEE